MDIDAFGRLAESFDGVRRGPRGPLARWTVRGRVLARQLDASHVVVRVPFDVRDLLLRQAPDVFSVPRRFRSHMMVVADLGAGDDDAIRDAVTSAWRLQSD